LRIVVAPNALKGSLTAASAAQAMAAGVLTAVPDAEVIPFPVADGGDGLLAVFASVPDLAQYTYMVTGPLGALLHVPILYSGKRRLAIIEMATAAGLALLQPETLDPMHATTQGVGELLRHALDLGAKRIVLGIGGSATNDGGTGLAVALGARFLDADGKEVPGNAAGLQRIVHIDLDQLDPRIARTRIEVACDVDNPLLGEDGTARVFAPQKGADPRQVEEIEAGLENLAEHVERQLGQDLRKLPGGGAAGGLGYALVAFLQAELRPGAELVLELTGFEASLSGADLVLTAEGRLDRQTLYGKAPAAVARVAKRHGIPCIALAGSLDQDLEGLHAAGISACFSICPGPMTLEAAQQQAAPLLTRCCEQAVRSFLSGISAAGQPESRTGNHSN